ncbi:MAG: sugar transferase [Bacteroidales bacterium]|nr:sugar transferase [Bacteroidales bacterium]MCF8389126.1 sugar transferase [Bacteroidales bacterium]
MNKRGLVMLITDQIILMMAFLFMVAYKPGSLNYLTTRYFAGFGLLFFSWALTSILFKKYSFKRKHSFSVLMNRIIISDLAALSIVSVFIIAFSITGYSRLIFFGTVGIAAVVEIFIGNLYFFLIHTINGKTDLVNPPPKASDLAKAYRAIDYHEKIFSEEAIANAIILECGQTALEFIQKHNDLTNPKVLTVSTSTRFNIEFQPINYFEKIINLKRTNDLQYINKFFESINRKIPLGGYYTGCVEPKNQRKERILRKYPPVMNWIMYSFDFIIKRVFPKFILTKKIYFILTRGNNRVITRAETLGRLYSCGFEVVEERDIDNYFYFVVKKIGEPVYDMNPSYGPFVKLKRIGKDGKLIKVYKLRTMHPYSEYLQDYIYKMHQLQSGGKFKNDFRISTIGKFFRIFWLDELPMTLNLLKGNLKLVGVRPISKHYFDLYSAELQQKRIKNKPGLVPPFYADLPKTLEEIQASELRYLDEYDKKPFRTDWKYFWRAIWNILFKKARSK